MTHASAAQEQRAAGDAATAGGATTQPPTAVQPTAAAAKVAAAQQAAAVRTTQQQLPTLPAVEGPRGGADGLASAKVRPLAALLRLRVMQHFVPVATMCCTRPLESHTS